MKRVLRLTESDLMRIVRRVISEESENLLGKTISGDINPSGNHPGSASIKLTSKNGLGYDGVIREWDFGSDWGIKVGDKVAIKNTSNMSKCNVTFFSGKLKNITLENCEVN